MHSFNLQKPIAIGSDHAGFEYKTALVNWLQEKGYEIKDFGTYDNKSVDYPDYAHPVASAVANQEAALGILLCGSANGVAIAANKHSSIRAGIAWQEEIAKLMRMHNDANIICIPARYITLEQAAQMIRIFIDTPFEGGRHLNRVNKIPCNK